MRHRLRTLGALLHDGELAGRLAKALRVLEDLDVWYSLAHFQPTRGRTTIKRCVALLGAKLTQQQFFVHYDESYWAMLAGDLQRIEAYGGKVATRAKISRGVLTLTMDVSRGKHAAIALLPLAFAILRDRLRAGKIAVLPRTGSDLPQRLTIKITALRL